jgi:hypothetical protein
LPRGGGAAFVVEQCVQQRLRRCSSSGCESGVLPSADQPPKLSM